MHATLGSSSSLPFAQNAAIKMDVASQTECHHQVAMTTGRAINCTTLPSQSVCPDVRTENAVTSTDKSLSDYAVGFVKGSIQAGLQGSNKLIRCVAGLASQHIPDIKQGLMFLATMPAFVGSYPVSTNPAYGYGSNETGTPFTSSSAYPSTNLTGTPDPDSNPDGDSILLGVMFGSFAVSIVVICAYTYCSEVYSSCRQLKRDNPRALNRHALQAALKNPLYGEGAQYRQPRDRLRLPVPPQRPVAPTTREIATQTICERGTQTEPPIDASAPQEQEPPTYAEATAFLV